MNSPTLPNSVKKIKNPGKVGIASLLIMQLLACSQSGMEKQHMAGNSSNYQQTSIEDNGMGGAAMNESVKDAIVADTSSAITPSVEDTNQQAIDYNLAIADSIYQEFQQQVAIKPSTIAEVSSNIEVLGAQINKSDAQTLMIIAQSEHCNTTLLAKVAGKLQQENLLTDKRKNKLVGLFNMRLQEETNKIITEASQGKDANIDEIKDVRKTLADINKANFMEKISLENN